jgi:hypothetical protein
VADHPHYHKPTDTFARIAHGFFQRVVHLLLDVVNELDADLTHIHTTHKQLSGADGSEESGGEVKSAAAAPEAATSAQTILSSSISAPSTSSTLSSATVPVCASAFGSASASTSISLFSADSKDGAAPLWPHAHPLRRTVQPYSTRWFCDLCDGAFKGPSSVSHHCADCQFDVCPPCFEARSAASASSAKK